MVVLRRHCVPVGGHDILATSFAPINARMGGSMARLRDCIKRRMIGMREVIRVLIASHNQAFQIRVDLSA